MGTCMVGSTATLRFSSKQRQPRAGEARASVGLCCPQSRLLFTPIWLLAVHLAAAFSAPTEIRTSSSSSGGGDNSGAGGVGTGGALWHRLAAVSGNAGSRLLGSNGEFEHPLSHSPSVTSAGPAFLRRRRILSNASLANHEAEHEAGLRRKLAKRKSSSSKDRSREIYSRCNIWVGKRRASFTRVQDAVNHVGGSVNNPRKKRVYICIKPGKYSEIVRVKPGQNYITLVGSGRSTVISGGNSKSKVGSPYYAATLVVEGDFFSAELLVIENTVKTTWDPAPAVSVIGKHSQWLSVGFVGWVDTIGLFTSQHLFVGAYVSGITDVIWGFGRAMFLGSEIFSRLYYDPNTIYIGYLTAMGTDWPSNGVSAGAVFQGCTIRGTGSTYLGRPYRAQARVVYVNSYLSKAVVPQGWSDWNGFYGQGQVDFKEINCKGPGASSSSRQYCSVWGSSDVPWDFQKEAFLKMPWR